MRSGDKTKTVLDVVHFLPHVCGQVLADIVEMLGTAGIYSILDCHQDLWSPKFCGEQLGTSLSSIPFHTLAFHTMFS